MKDLFYPGIKRYLWVPILINVLIFAPLFYYGLHAIWEKLSFLSVSLPNWLSWLTYVLTSIKYFIIVTVATLMLGIFSVLATVGANLIASPFNGLLSESLANKLGAKLPTRPLLQTAGAAIYRELVKLWYYLPRIIALLVVVGILYFIPILNLLSPILFYWFGAWMMAIQYVDYPADNDHMSFDHFVIKLKERKALYLGFGFITALFASIPFVNFIIMPAAVLGATRLWLDGKEENLQPAAEGIATAHVKRIQ
jgi:CysZ protein